MKIPPCKLLFFVLLISGCAREYECDVGTIDTDGEFHSIAGPDSNTQFGASSTGDWSYTKEEAEKRCEESYNDSVTDTKIPDDIVTHYYCRCARAN